MSNLATLARPYAKAAFELAGSDLSTWGASLGAAAVVVGNETIADWLSSPDVDTSRVIALIGDAVEGPLNEKVERFFGVLADNDRLALLPLIAEQFNELRAEAENRLEVKVVSAVALEADQAERMKAALARRFNRDIQLDNVVDATVLGGAVIYAGDQVIDGSLKGRLNNLQNSLV